VQSIEELTAQREAEEQARREAEAQAKKEAEEKAAKEAEEKARWKAQQKAKRDTKEQAKQDAEEQARKEAEELQHKRDIAEAVKVAEEKAKKESRARERERAKRAADEQAIRQAEEKARREQEEADLIFERFNASIESATPKPKQKKTKKKKKDDSPFAGGPSDWKAMEAKLAKEQMEVDKRKEIEGPWVQKFHSPAREAARNPHLVAGTKAEVERIYSKHCPEKLGKVDELMAKFRGDEEKLLEKVRKKYDEVAPSSKAPAVAHKGNRTSALPASGGGMWQSVSKAKKNSSTGGAKGSLSSKKSSSSSMKKRNSAGERREISSYWLGRVHDEMYGELFRYEKLRKVWKSRVCLISNGGAADGDDVSNPVFMWLTAGDELGSGPHKDSKGEIALTRDRVSVQGGGTQKHGKRGTTIHLFNIVTNAGGSVTHTFGAQSEADMERWVSAIEVYASPKSNMTSSTSKFEL
jgi:hypothetical protein